MEWKRAFNGILILAVTVVLMGSAVVWGGGGRGVIGPKNRKKHPL